MTPDATLQNSLNATASARAALKIGGTLNTSCHTPTVTTGASPYTGLSNVTYSPYSDFALHNKGSGLSDGITQGVAGPKLFRTAPLWGLGQRLFFMHDGRTADSIQATQADNSTGSEANQVVKAYNKLKTSQQQDLLNFLRSL